MDGVGRADRGLSRRRRSRPRPARPGKRRRARRCRLRGAPRAGARAAAASAAPPRVLGVAIAKSPADLRSGYTKVGGRNSRCGSSSAFSTAVPSPIPSPTALADDGHVPPIDPADPFRGSEAVSTGRLTAYRLRSTQRRIFPDVYADAAVPTTPHVLVRGAFLWAPAGSVIGGLGAALLHRERWYAAEAATREVDVYALGAPRSTNGIRIRKLTRALPPDHVVSIGGVRVTSVARTAVDVARWEDDDDTAIAKIDAVCNRGHTDVHEVITVAEQMKGLHGVRRVRALLRWCDERADSPRETRLRLMLLRAGLPAPTPQLKIYNEYGVKIATADLGYEQQRVAIFYDSEIHREKSNWEFDAWVNAQLAELGWLPVRVTAQMMRTPPTLIRQIRAALTRAPR